VRITQILVVTAAVLFLVLASAAASSASAAEPATAVAHTRSLAPPVVAKLSDEPEARSAAPTRRTRNGLGSAGGQLAATVSLIVFALFISALASGREARE